MANFNPPFSTSADKRFPTSDERQNGFSCGPADRELFNGLYHRIEAEIGNVISAAGLTPTDTDLTQLRQAIQAMIDASTGGGDPDNYLLLTQARSRLPIFPEVQTDDGRITVINNGSGSVRLPGGVGFLHRGIFPVTTAQTDFTTVASQTYHLRWNPTDGFVLKRLSDVAYNPAALAETSPFFDSGYDDMLIARIITNSSNAPTITNLSNKSRLLYSQYSGRITTGIIYEFDGPGYGNYSARRPNNILEYNFARTPILTSINAVMGAMAPGPQGAGIHGVANVIYNKSVTRYQTKFDLLTDYGPGASQFYCEYDFQTMI